MLHWLNAALLPAQLITVSCCHVRTTSDGRKTEVLGLRRPRAGQAALHTGSRTETTDAHYFTIHGPVSVVRDTKKVKLRLQDGCDVGHFRGALLYRLREAWACTTWRDKPNKRL
ncbi:hypothetical protein CI102_12866 [Trichoderma harzianum]|uniref:Secreted protein n=1 Tax=Trichoderma harzianum CBS 226.95 TaxID=983964 RepID=A0A2T4AL82_TRIHA|nr:hypothetical protein M431DRAFT_505377 [Trichoderma harzianum CBS 226.95]PKK43119.1 hypothetical protein CI102_12866 [Trichoderma harzianum]PTB57813.1 hypothetical protein M431DRAFT_505377 [Trichoderma harzianum CBS 226.95]